MSKMDKAAAVRAPVVSYFFPKAAPGKTLVHVHLDTDREDYGAIVSGLDDLHKRCSDNDVFHLLFIGYCGGLEVGKRILRYSEKLLKPNPAFTRYACAYGTVAEQQQPLANDDTGTAAPSPKEKGKGKKPATPPSPLAALLQAEVVEEQQLPAPREPLQTPEEAAAMKERLDNIWDEVPDGMVAE